MGYLRPNDCLEPTDEPKVRRAQNELKAKLTQKERDKIFPHIPSLEEQINNEQDYELKKDKFALKTFVYLDFNPTALGKKSTSCK